MDNLKEATLQSELRFKDLVINPCHRSGAEGRTRTGTPSLTADFEFIHGASRRFVLNLTTSLNPPDFTGLVRLYRAE